MLLSLVLKDTHKRLGMASALMVDPITKAATCSLRNVISQETSQASVALVHSGHRIALKPDTKLTRTLKSQGFLIKSSLGS